MKTLLCLLLFPLSLFAHLNGSGDFQIWNTDTVHIRTSRKTMFIGQTEFRYGRDSSKLYYKHYQGEIVFIRSPHTLVGFGYRQTYHREHKEWKKEYHPRCILTFQTKTNTRWFISNRNQVVYRIKEGNNRWVYRNRLEFITPYRMTRRGMVPFFSEEFFWEETRGINQNRLVFGLRIPYHQRTQLDLSYMLRSHKNHNKDWLQQNILGIHFSLFF